MKDLKNKKRGKQHNSNKISPYILFIFILLIFCFSLINIFADFFSSARTILDYTDCNIYFGNYSGCRALNASCMWRNNSGSPLQEVWCPLNYTNYNSNSGNCTNWPGPNAGRTCTQITGGLLVNAGCCAPKTMGGGGGGNAPNSCASFDRNETGCVNSSLYTSGAITGCSWKPNNQNQNPSCYNNVGCCMKLGCWEFRGEQTSTNNCTSALGGVCILNVGGGCPEAGGCCAPKACTEAASQSQCEGLQSLGNACNWTGLACSMMGGGGFSAYNNNTDSCMKNGGWVNASGNCVMAGTGTSGGGGGGGGFMFASEARCWFASQMSGICRNITGCVFCSSASGQIDNASSACYQQTSGNCVGHEPRYVNYNGSYINITDINFSSMICSDIKVKQTCVCGPMPNCKWNNNSAVSGVYCEAGMKTDDEMRTCEPPAKFCEDNSAKNNYTLCMILANNFMMPCKWGNASSNRTSADNCTFNNVAVFGAAGGDTDYNIISSESSCVAAGGTWKESYYFDSDGSFKQDSWCEKGALFSFSSGTANANKGSCDSDCWACEFNSTGSNYGSNLTLARNACQNSKKGVCVFKNDTHAPNGLGWCDYPKEFSFGGAKDCNIDCKGCEFVGNSSQAQSACSNSIVGCTWVNDSNAMNGKGGYCMSASKKSCLTDCSSCYSQTECSNNSFHLSMNCSWAADYKFCKPFGFTGEVCFNGKDDDNDGQADCVDSDCFSDQFCGGASMGSGGVDCKKLNITSCNLTVSSSGKNCTLVTPDYSGMAYCDFPGTDCWKYDDNISICKENRGCIYRNVTGGYPNGPSETVIIQKSFNGFCNINQTKANVCFNATNRINFALCNATNECTWIVDNYSPIGGRCEFKPFGLCGSANNLAECSAGFRSSICSWRNDSYSSKGGFCEVSCMGKSLEQCSEMCSWKSSICEPEMFGGISGGGGGGIGGGGFGCHANDGNITACNKQNVSCSWNAFSQNSSQGVCNPKGEQMMMSGMDMGPPKILGVDANDTNIPWIDIKQYGVKDMTSSLAFGILVRNITNASICRGYYIGMMGGPGSQPQLANGTATTKFYWFLDTNKNSTDGCNATNQSGANITGFEFFIKYNVALSNITLLETKSFYKCSEGIWVLTNVPLSSNRQMMCGMSMPFEGMIGGAMIIVDKETLASFSSYNKTAPMRVFVSSANDSNSELNPVDSANPGYYTQGSADFKFVDCMNPANQNDDKCKNFNKFGFNIFEDCKNGVDDDGDDMSDCTDPKCKFTPVCSSGTAFNFVSDANDKQAPSVAFSQVDTLHNSAFVKFDSDEPSNGTFNFYGNDSTCMTINKSISELGDPSVTFDDYKPFHGVNLNNDTIPGFGADGFVNGTFYYYKTIICDTSGNCADSACLNFTTKSENAYKNFIFKMKLPSGYNVSIPALNYSGNFTRAFGGNVYDVGIKTNASMTRNINITVNCGNQSITFIGVDLMKPKDLDLTTAFVCNISGNVLGMNSSSKSWNQVVSDMGMGGSGDYLKLSYPISYNSSNNITWCNDELTNCTNVNTYANCSNGGTEKTDCKIPTSLGFSAYKITTTTTTGGGSPPSGGGGGGGGTTPVTYTITDSQLVAGYTENLAGNDKIKFTLKSETHYVNAEIVSSTYVKVNVSSTPVKATLNIGDLKKFDVDGDGKYYDISLKLNGVNIVTYKANLTIKAINEVITSTSGGITGAVAGEGAGAGETGAGEEGTGREVGAGATKSNKLLWIVIIVIVIVIAVIAYIFMNKKRRY